MKLWRWVLVLLIVAAAAALAWHWLAADPGYVYVRLGRTTLETSVVVAIAALLLAWLVAGLIWRLLRWPFRAWGRAHKRRGRERLANGLTAFAEGDYLQAERDLDKAAQHAAFRTPALLVLARAAHERGARERATQALDEAEAGAARATTALRARFFVDEGREREAFDLLKKNADADTLCLRGRRLLIDTALDLGESQVALDALPALLRSQSLTASTLEQLETRALAAALAAAPDVASLNALWNRASRAQRRREEAIEAFARRSASQGQMLAAMDEIESAQRRQWSDRLATVYGELGDGEAAARLRQAEGWPALAPNSAALQLTLGRLQLQQGQHERAEESLQRALALAPSAAAWETLGDLRRAAEDPAGAATAFANALHCARGQATQTLAPLRAPRALDTQPIAFEERSEHGVPRLPHSS